MAEPTPPPVHQTVDDLIDYLLGIRDLYGPGVPVWLVLGDDDQLIPTRVPLVAMDTHDDGALACTLYGGGSGGWGVGSRGKTLRGPCLPPHSPLPTPHSPDGVSEGPPVCSACVDGAP